MWTLGHRPYPRVLFATEQEEENNCWGVADGGASASERHRSESELGHHFPSDDAKLDELPAPKFTSLRHLRQVNSELCPPRRLTSALAFERLIVWWP